MFGRQGSPRRLTVLAGCSLLALFGSIPLEAMATHRPGHGQPGGGNQGGGSPISIAASPTSVTAGSSAAIAGKLTGSSHSGVSVDLQANPHPFTGGFKTVATKSTDTNGSYSFSVRPTAHTRFRVVAKTSPPSTSAETLVQVRIRVTRGVSDATPARGRLVSFSGFAYPAHDGQAVSIKRRTADGRYVTVATTTLRDAGTSRSSYSRRIRIRRSGTYRVRVSGHADHLSGNSSAVRITVH